MSAYRPLSTLLILLAFTGSAATAEYRLPGRVLFVVDGDSLVLDVRGSQYRIELDEIDAPELNQPWGPEASEWLSRSLTGRFVVVQQRQTLADGRVRGRVMFGGRDVGLDLLHEGLAWHALEPATGLPDQNAAYRDAEDTARSHQVGLWADESPVPPWKWRRPGVRPPR